MKTLTEKQKALIAKLARDAKVDVDLVIQWLEEEKTTISELSMGILGKKVN